MKLFKPFFDFMINVITQLDKDALMPLKIHTGKIIGFEFKEFSKTLYFKILAEKVDWLPEMSDAETANTLISGDLKDFVNIWAKSKKQPNLQTKIHIHGDMELAEAFHNVFRDFDVDWEEQFSYVLGDTLAFQLSEVAKSTHAWGKEFLSHRSQDLTEYLQYEKKCLPCQEEVSEFCKAVDTLRDDTERMAIRVAQLQNQLRGA